MKVLMYWLARTLLFVAVLAILWGVGWRDLFAMVAAFIVAWLVSYLVLPRMRKAAAEQMDGWITRAQRPLAEADADEDAEIEGRERP